MGEDIGISGLGGRQNSNLLASMDTMNVLFDLAMKALKAQHDITDTIFKLAAQADKELAAFTKQLEKSRLPQVVKKIGQMQAKIENLLTQLKMTGGLDSKEIQTKLAGILGRLEELKQEAVQRQALSSGPTPPQDPNLI